MSRISVYIDLEDLDEDDIINELCRRIKSKYNSISKENTDKLKNALNIKRSILVCSTLEDSLKQEHIDLIFDKYTSSQIEEALPIK